MARTLTAKDCHALMNLLVKEATGQDATIQAVDSSTFVSAGELVLATGTENVLNALSLVLGRTFMAVRPYGAKLNLINAVNTGEYTHRMRKISFYSREAQASGDWNTQLFTNLADGFTNGQNIDDGSAQSTKSMWEQNQPVPLEMNFAGQNVWQDSTTVYEYQLQQAFRSEAEFAEFVSGIMTERGNDIESQKEAYNRMTLLNFMAGVYDLDQTGSVVNLTEAFNEEFDTNYKTADLLSTYLKEFAEFFAAKIRIDSDRMTNRSKKNHWSPAKTIGDVSYTLLRHTPKDRQRLFLYEPLMIKTKAYVYPSLFNEEYLQMSQYEGVQFWQNEVDPSAIKVTPAIPDVAGTNSGAQTAGDQVALDYVVGLLFDEDALMIDYQLERSAVSPLEARKGYRNTWWTFSKNSICDFTENAILYYMADSE